MSVLVSSTMRQRLWRGYDDPSLPVGMWVGQIALTGDATGGTETLLLEFDPQENVNTKSGRFFNLEAFEIQSSSAGAPGQLLIINFSQLIDGAAVNRSWTAQSLSNEAGDSALPLESQLKRPIFLGTPLLAGTTASIRWIQNNADTETVVMYAEGYIWEGRSVMAEGGLQRPVQSLYG